MGWEEVPRAEGQVLVVCKRLRSVLKLLGSFIGLEFIKEAKGGLNVARKVPVPSRKV